jgi:hypothetical protein
MKNPRILMGALLVCAAAACSEPTAPGLPSIPIPDDSPASGLPSDPIPSRLSPPGG